MTPRDEYLAPLSPDNAAVLFVDNRTGLMPGTRSIDPALPRDNIEGLARLAAIHGLPVVLTTTGGGADGPTSPLIAPITETFPRTPVFDRQDHLNAMDDPRFADATDGRFTLTAQAVSDPDEPRRYFQVRVTLATEPEKVSGMG